MQNVVVVFTEHSLIRENMPSFEFLTELVRGIQLPAGSRWLSQYPRVTRVWDTGVRTTVVMAAQIPDGAPMRALLLGSVDDRLRTTGMGDSPRLGYDWRNVRVDPYVEGINGPVSFWTTDQAWRTETHDTIHTIDSRFSLEQNPYGPDDAALRPPTPAEIIARQTGAKLPDWLKGLGVAIAVGTLIWVAAPAAGAASRSYAASVDQETAARRARGKARKNPAKKRRRKRRSS